jgi:hypothetical protein
LESLANIDRVDIDSELDSHYDFRRAYEAINHPEKERILTTLMSISLANPLSSEIQELDDARYRRQGTVQANIIRYGTLYFGLSAELLAKAKAEQHELERLQLEHDGMSLEQMLESGQFDRPRYLDETTKKNLVFDTSTLSVDEIIEYMIRVQMNHVYNVAYQGAGGLPDFAQYHGDGGTVAEIIASGIVLAERIGGLDVETYAKAAGSVGYGDYSMVIMSYRWLIKGMDRARNITIDGEPIQLPQDYARLGHALFMSSQSTAMHVLDLHQEFWPDIEVDEDECTELSDREQIFDESDVLFMCQDSKSSLHYIMRYRALFPDLTPELFIKVVQNIKPSKSGLLLDEEWCEYRGFEYLIESFGLDKIGDVTEATKLFLSFGHNDLAWKFYSTLRKKRMMGMEIFKSNCNEDSVLFTEAIMNGELSSEHLALGITEAGLAGVEQMRQVIRSIEKFVLSEAKTDDEIQAEINKINGSAFYARLWRVAVRFNVTTYGNKDTDEIIRVLERMLRQRKDGEVKPLAADVYKAAKGVKVREHLPNSTAVNSDAKKLMDHYFEYFQLAWSSGVDFGRMNGEFNDRVEKLGRDLAEALADVELRITDLPDDAPLTVKNALQKQRQIIIGALSTDFEADLLASDGFLAAYEKLGDVKMARSILREKALRDAKDSNWDGIERPIKQLLDSSRGDEDREGSNFNSDAALMLDLIDHVVVQEYLMRLKPGDRKYQQFIKGKLFNTTIINNALAKSIGSKGQEDSSSAPIRILHFIPTRDLGLELSGQIGDACWASKHSSIAEDKPNLTAVLMAEQKPDGTQQLIGSSLFIEAESEDGEELLIVRGLNPIQNFIGQVDPNDFLRTFMDYAKQTADRAGRTLAMVHDHTGGASTNRPSLFHAMTAYKNLNGLAKVKVPEVQVAFNGYELSDDIYVHRT